MNIQWKKTHLITADPELEADCSPATSPPMRVQTRFPAAAPRVPEVVHESGVSRVVVVLLVLVKVLVQSWPVADRR